MGKLKNICDLTKLYFSQIIQIKVLLYRYLLYNFAGTLPVDLPKQGSKIFFLCSTILVNLVWMAGNIGTMLLAEYSELPGQHVIADMSTQYLFVMGKHC